MFNLGFSEVVVILILALILLGPSKLPDLARSIGKGMREIKKATDDLKGVWDEELGDTLRDEVPRLKPPDIRAAARQALDQAWPEDLPGRPGPGHLPASQDQGPDVADPGGPHLPGPDGAGPQLPEPDVADPGGPHLGGPYAAAQPGPAAAAAQPGPAAAAAPSVNPAPPAGGADPAPDASEPPGGDKHSA